MKSLEPSRFVLIGMSRHSRLLFVVSVEAKDNIRIISARERHLTSGRFIKMVRKRDTDLSRYDWSKATRGKYLDKAKRSFESVLLDRKAVETLGGPDALREIVATLAKSVREGRKKRRAA